MLHFSPFATFSSNKILFMKRVTLLTIFSCSLSAVVLAQSGSLLLCGNAGFTSQNYSRSVSEKTRSLVISPGVGYQFSNHLTAGVYLSYAGQRDLYNDTISFHSGTVLAGPFLRYTIPLSSMFSIYFQFGVNYSHASSASSQPNVNTFGTSLFPALFVNIKNGFGLNFSFGAISYSSQVVKGQSGSVNDFGINFGQAVNIGISKNICFKKHA
jgi:hypothetical protein